MYLILLAIISIGAAAYIIWYSENQKKKLAQHELEQQQAKLEAEKLFKQRKAEFEAEELLKQRKAILETQELLKKQQQERLEAEKLLKQQQEDIINQIINNIEADFEKIGWTEWDGSIHRADGQLERIKRAAYHNNGLSLTQYSPRTGFGIVRGSSGESYLVNCHRCSCPDFRERQLPCKHMYFLAMLLVDANPETGVQTKEASKYIPEYASDNVLSGIKFDIVGRNQNEVKEFITKHGGAFGNTSWRETDALITTGTMETQKLLYAKERNIEILTFDELQNLFDNYAQE